MKEIILKVDVPEQFIDHVNGIVVNILGLPIHHKMVDQSDVRDEMGDFNYWRQRALDAEARQVAWANCEPSLWQFRHFADPENYRYSTSDPRHGANLNYITDVKEFYVVPVEPKQARELSATELQAEINRLQQLLHRKVCGDPGIGVTVQAEGSLFNGHPSPQSESSDHE